MKGIIIYKSKYGSTKEYAEWLREETGFALVDAAHSPGDLRDYDVVVLGSSVFAGRLAIAGWIRTHWPALQDKTILLLLTHIRQDPQELAAVVPRSLPAEMAERITVFPVGGRYALQRMTVLNRTLIKMVSSMEKNPEVKDELLTDKDYVNRDDLHDILAHIRAIQTGRQTDGA